MCELFPSLEEWLTRYHWFKIYRLFFLIKGFFTIIETGINYDFLKDETIYSNIISTFLGNKLQKCNNWTYVKLSDVVRTSSNSLSSNSGLDFSQYYYACVSLKNSRIVELRVLSRPKNLASQETWCPKKPENPKTQKPEKLKTRRKGCGQTL